MSSGVKADLEKFMTSTAYGGRPMNSIYMQNFWICTR